MVSHWKPLNLSIADTSLPPLLMKYDFGPFHYDIFLTDLTSIWTESLERKQIVKRALILDTSIDPSENKEQLQLLLRNVQKALDGEDATKVSLSRGDNVNQLDLLTTTPLPASFKPLKWPFHLDSAPRDLLTEELLLPCVSQLSATKVQIASLLRQLKEKDHVITKLTDKMQADGTEISKVFPGAAGIKIRPLQNVREIAGKSVRGLSYFDEDQWRNELLPASGVSFNLPEILSHVFAPSSEDIPETKFPPGSRTWWQQLKREEYQEPEGAVPALPQPSELSSKLEISSINDEEFQRQIAPPPAKLSADDREGKCLTTDMEKNQGVTPKSSPENDDTTTDGSDVEASSRNSQDPPPNSSTRNSLAQTCGSNLLLKDQLDLSLVHRPTLVQEKPDLIKDVAPAILTNKPDHEDDGLHEVTSPKPRPRLGRIGGKAKGNKESETLNQTPILEQIRSDESNEVDTMQAEGSERRLLNPEISESTRTARTSVRSKPPLGPRETSQERANIKREILKRELENKSHARVRKKRKF